MSIDGCVLCSCLDDGRAVPPPCPVEFDEAWVHPAPGYEHLRKQVRQWAQTACPHPQFRLVDGQVHRGGLSEALDAHGGVTAYPALVAALPRFNGGQVPPEDAARCLAELDQLGKTMAAGTMVVILDAEDGSIVYVRDDHGLIALPGPLAAYPAMIRTDGQYRTHGLDTRPGVLRTTTWLDTDATIRVRDADTGHTLFVSSEVRQRADGERWVFHDISTGAHITHSTPIPRPDGGFPDRLQVQTRPIDIDVYIFGVRLLRSLFTASVQTGRPVIWH